MKLFGQKKSMRLRTEITLFYLAIIVLALGILIVCTQVYISHANENSLRQFVSQTLSTTGENLQGKFNNIDKIVDIMFINAQFQSQIQSADTYLDRRRVLSDPMLRVLLNDLSVFSVVYITPSEEFFVETSENYTYRISPGGIQSDAWQERLKESNGEVFCLMDGGGVVENLTTDAPFVSFAREIQRLSDYKGIGLILVNISGERLGETLSAFTADSGLEIYLCDGAGRTVANSDNATGAGQLLAANLLAQSDPSDGLAADGMSAYTAKLNSEYVDWTFVGVMPDSLSYNNSDYFVVFTLILGAVVIVLIFVGQVFITGMISAPLEQLARHMSEVENAHFVTIPINENGRYDEIKTLQLFFNKMITSMDRLIATIEAEEQIKRQNEIALLQEQIKPHFLYNALDAVSALCLINENETAYRLTQALSGYYRPSLSGGREVVDIKTEIDCVRNYVTVLNIRYADKIHMHYEVPDELLSRKVLKLILQPLIENSVYHGIRNKHGPGHIKLTVFQQVDGLVFMVEDDGVGMTPETISEVLHKTRHTNRGFGIYNLIEKIELFYGVKAPLRIESELNVGTKISITVGMLE